MSDGRLRGSLTNERPSAITEPHAANASGVCRVAIGKMRRENMDENLEELAQDLAKAELKGDVAFWHAPSPTTSSASGLAASC